MGLDALLVCESGYGDIDATGKATNYVRRLDNMRASPFWHAIKERTFELLEASSGKQLLDVGCGAGDDVRALSRLTGEEGRVVGVDSSSAMIAEARRRSAGLGQHVAFECADARALPFGDETFDGCRAERVLQHVLDPQRVLTEMVRVLRPGGRLVVVEPDYGSLVVRGGDPGVTSAILRARREHFRSGRIGSQLPRLIRELGLQVSVQVRTLATTTWTPDDRARVQKYADSAAASSRISEGERAQWLHDVESAGHSGRYYHGLAIFIVTGCRA